MGHERFLNHIFKIFLVLESFFAGSGTVSKFALDPDPYPGSGSVSKSYGSVTLTAGIGTDWQIFEEKMGI